MTRKRVPIAAFGFVLSVGIGIGVWLVNPAKPALPLLAAAFVGLMGAILGVTRSRRDKGRVDIFHPLIFPLVYTSLSFLAPAWAMMVSGTSFSVFTPGDLASNTAKILMAAIIGMALGLAVRFKRSIATLRRDPDPQTQLHLGRLLLLLPLAIAGQDAVSGAVLTRGIAQTTYTGATVVESAAEIIIPVALLLILNAHRTLFLGGLMTRLDWALVLGLVALSGVSGDRGKAVTVVICILYAYTRRKFKIYLISTAVIGILAFAVGVSSYRQSVRGGTGGGSVLNSILEDWSVATYTTGLTAHEVPLTVGYKLGETYWVGIVRQLPSPVANWFLGPPYDTANYVFRDSIGFNNANLGIGYSIPAEGYLNFGIVGTFLACMTFGLFISWSYSRLSWPLQTGAALFFPVAVAVLPVVLRSDALGSVKLILYPVILGSLSLLLATVVTGRFAGAAPPPQNPNLRAPVGHGEGPFPKPARKPRVQEGSLLGRVHPHQRLHTGPSGRRRTLSRVGDRRLGRTGTTSDASAGPLHNQSRGVREHPLRDP